MSGCQRSSSARPRQRGSRLQGNPPSDQSTSTSHSLLLLNYILWSILSPSLNLSSYVTQSSPIKQGYATSASSSSPAYAYWSRYLSPSPSHVEEPHLSHYPSLDPSVTSIYDGDEWGGCISGPREDQYGHCNADSVPDGGTEQAQGSHRRLHACWPVVLSTQSDF